jgi:hypothetical protein
MDDKKKLKDVVSRFLEKKGFILSLIIVVFILLFDAEAIVRTSDSMDVVKKLFILYSSLAFGFITTFSLEIKKIFNTGYSKGSVRRIMIITGSHLIISAILLIFFDKTLITFSFFFVTYYLIHIFCVIRMVIFLVYLIRKDRRLCQ